MARGSGTTKVRAGETAEEPVASGRGSSGRGAAEGRGRGARPAKRGEELRQALVIELHTLRLQAQGAVEQYSLRVNAQIAEVLRVAEGEATAAEMPRRLPAKVAADLLDHLRAVKLKPKKGRAKDLQRIQELVEELMRRLPQQE